MKTTVTLSTAHVNSNLHETVGQLLKHTLARFATHIAQASIVLSDENGPRGGVDKLCRVHLTMPGVGTVTTTARHVSDRRTHKRIEKIWFQPERVGSFNL